MDERSTGQEGHNQKEGPTVAWVQEPSYCVWAVSSLPEFMNFKLFGKTILVVNIKFGLFLGHPLSQ